LLEIAKTHCQMGLCYFLSARNYQKAEQYFEQACTVFSENGIELFYALCLTYWGQVSIISGNLQTAASQLHKARAIFTKYELLGLTAENYNDSGQLELLRGNPTGGIDHFKKAEAIYRQSGVLLSAAIALANQGDAFAMIGQFQNALHHLELAESEFQALNNPSRLAGCEMYLSKIMTDLNQYTIAHEYLDKAEELFIQVKQDALLAQVYAQRAKIFSLQTRYNEVISSLNRALEIAKQYNAEPQVALAERQLGEVLSITEHSNDAFKIISGAEKKFGEMGLVMEQAASLIALGYHSVREMVTSSDAENAFKQALGICRGVTPELESQAFIGLAMLAEKQGHLEVALENYREALRAIANSRSGFWQPSLAGSYLQRSVRINDEAIGLAVILKAHTDAFMFIESNKAQSLVKQMKFSNPYQLSGLPVNIENLRLEIQALQQQLRVTYDSGPMVQLSKLKNIQRRLIECAREYDRKLEQIERKTVTGSKEDMMPLQFNVNSFVNFANKAYGKSWVALDYYLTDHILFGSVITPDGHHTWATNISMKERIAINACTETYLNMQPPSLRQLNLLGNLLIPPGLENYLSTDTLLIIVPHRDLHQIPWAALQADSFGKSLVEISIPVVVPSLQVLQIIWERANQNVKPDRKTGLLVGVANFKEFRQPLPQVHHEIEALSQKANPESITLVDASANKNALTELLDDASPRWSGLSRFSFFHIASHIIYDSRTGRLTSIALYNDEIWLDQLRDFAPLPKLVTLSACNGTQSLVFTGDEQVGLATTCLIAGTDAVVGSLWPILDSTTADLMIDFYDAYFTGCSPAKALAQAQRNALQNNKKLENWASFIFIGTP
jgi:CHAT domain-containing protein